MRAIGVDACKSGWVAVALDDDAPPLAFWARSIGELADHVGPVDRAMAIDIPIGLPARAARSCDLAARQLLAGRQSSVFMTPLRVALEATSHAEATKVAAELTGKGISQQAFALARKIFEVEAWLASADLPVFEAHPEVSFREMNGGLAMSASKRTWAGVFERRAVLEQAGIVLEGHLGVAGRMAGFDDVLDAAAVAWTAARIVQGRATVLGSEDDLSSDGRLMRIWA